MISLFEEATTVWQRENIVEPLEFHTLEETGEIVEPPHAAGDSEPGSWWKEHAAEFEARLEAQAERTKDQIEAARSEAVMQTRAGLAEEMERRFAAERAEIARLSEQFGRERVRYFSEVEAEVVRLSLAIAARVLHREVVLDPMLLRAAVRVALDKVQGESNVTLRVPEDQAQRWREAFSAEHGEDLVTVIADRAMSSGDAVLETGVGRVELGVAEQLKEIERGFFDLLQKRPA